MTQYDVGVFIGRFQPFHYGHLHIVKSALAHCSKLVLIVGSYQRARSARNPFNFEERRELILKNLEWHDQINDTDYAKRVVISPVADRLYNESSWIADVKAAANAISKPHDRIVLAGYDKDSSTYYLKKFPEWAYLAFENYQGIDATYIRAAYFNEQMTKDVLATLPAPSVKFLEDFKKHASFLILQEEFLFINQYRLAWSQAPYPPKFVTTDAVLICANHVLLVQRKFNPGKGLWALPGGHLEPNEWIQTGLFRELREETSIDLSDEVLQQYLQVIKPFDHPQRSQIGRVITHAGLFKLPQQTLPIVVAADDALQAKWWPIKDLEYIQDQMHDDHYQIIQCFKSLLTSLS